ncbi:hypothetical protein DL240_19320 [Lujinxingia litoralis]|uniref:Uncharacterized protein n=1 Tax=Lujinxingia litoralis TaxID=2211119 RepID=A0A328C3Y3_9DELT|nr:hypothetical protein [Lujinxingia litoralis]RAL20002.1 hypothetical protein DL240_19320 [Lujinxingia litoralis]
MRYPLLYSLLFTTTLGALSGGCVHSEYDEGASLPVRFSSQLDAADTEAIPGELALVFDHLELLPCDASPARGLARLTRWLLPEAHAAHLPEAPHRLLGARAWTIARAGELAAPLEAGTLYPPLRDYCGVRVGFYSALPDSPALQEGMAQGESFYLHTGALLASPVELRSSLGFDVTLYDDQALSRERLSSGEPALEVHLDLSEFARRLRALPPEFGDREVAEILSQTIQIAIPTPSIQEL